MNEEDAQAYLNVIRQIMDSHGFSTLDAEIFNGFRVESAEEDAPITDRSAVWQLGAYLTRIDAYFRYFSVSRFDADLKSLNEQVESRPITDVVLDLDPTTSAQFGLEAREQSLRRLAERFDASQVVLTIRKIREHLGFGNDNEPPDSQNNQRPTPGG